MSVLTTQPIIFWADQVPTKLVICLKIESSVGRKYTVLAIMGSNTLSDAISIIFIHLSDVRKYSSSNWYVSLWHNIRCSRLIMCPKLVTLLDNLSYFCRIRHCVDHKGILYSISRSSNYAYTSKGGYETLKKQWMSVLTTKCYISWADLVSKIS